MVIPTIWYRLGNILKKKSKDKVVYLTFDDGPSKEYTNELLDLLSKYNIKATFFVLGEFAKESPSIINRMVNEGHEIGIHAQNHQNQMFRGYKFIKNEFEESSKILKELGVNVRYFRPPWGCFGLFTGYFAKQHGYSIMLWDVMAGDWSAKNTSGDIRDILLKKIKGKKIVCLHDGRGEDGAPARTIEALRQVIPTLQKGGYEFKKGE